MTEEEADLFEAYQREIENCYEIALQLDIENPDIPRAFQGTPSERIQRQLSAMKKSRK